MTKVLHIIDSLDVGGTERQCLEIVRGLSRYDFDVHLVHFRGGALDCDLGVLPVSHQQIGVGPAGSLTFWKGVRGLVKYMRDNRIEVVQTYGFYSNVPGILAAKLAGVGVIVAGKRELGQFLSPTQWHCEKWLWRYADKIVVNTSVIRDHLVHAGVPAARILVIHNGIDVRLFSIFDHNPQVIQRRVGMVAKFRHQKDHVTFLDAVAAIHVERPEVEFVLVGSGPLEGSTKQYAQMLGLTECVSFTGEQTNASLRRLLASFSVAVLCSHGNEGLPNVILEAMAAGKPVVATDVGGSKDAVLDGKTGFLVPPRDAKVLTERVIWLIDHPTEAKEMGLRGRQVAEEQFSLSRMHEAFAELYENLLQHKGMRPGLPTTGQLAG